jgi:uncharacterized membrane protein
MKFFKCIANIIIALSSVVIFAMITTSIYGLFIEGIRLFATHVQDFNLFSQGLVLIMVIIGGIVGAVKYAPKFFFK